MAVPERPKALELLDDIARDQSRIGARSVCTLMTEKTILHMLAVITVLELDLAFSHALQTRSALLRSDRERAVQDQATDARRCLHGHFGGD